MARNRLIIDCYTDEPAGLGVPPFIGTRPRYCAGRYRDRPDYITIDDLRVSSLKRPVKNRHLHPLTGRSRIDLLNTTKTPEETIRLLKKAGQFIVIAGIHTPGRYLSAEPGTIREVVRLLKPYRGTRILTGPAAGFGSQRFGGNKAEVAAAGDFDEVRDDTFSYEDINRFAIRGAALIDDIPHRRIVEIETGRGCPRSPGCSFCTEPLKNTLEWREPTAIIDEVRALYDRGARWFRLGAQSCIFSYGGSINALETVLSGISELQPEVFHVDNASPASVTVEKIGLFCRYLTPGSTAALGVESFDETVARENNLNTCYDEVYDTVRMFTRHGAERGENGMPHFLPGINLILGLTGETAQTLERNYEALRTMYDDGLLFRRINIRRVVPFPGTVLHERTGLSVLRKNRNLHDRFIEKVRRDIDGPMLRRLFPVGTVLRGCIAETFEGNVTFLRQPGSYPVIVGVRERLRAGERYNISVTGYGKRSITGTVVSG